MRNRSARGGLGGRVVAEEGLDVALQTRLQMLVGPAALELTEGEVDLQIGDAGISCSLDLRRVVAALDEAQRPTEAAEALGQVQEVLHLGLVRRAAELQPAPPQPVEGFAVGRVALGGAVPAGFRDPLGRHRGRRTQSIAPAAIARHQEPLLQVLVAEKVVHPRCHRDRLFVQGSNHKGLDLGLGVVLLEGPPTGEHPIAKAPTGDLVLVGEHNGDHQQPLGQRIGPRQCIEPFVEVLDDVDHEAKVDDIGGHKGLVRRVVGVPAGGPDAIFPQPAQVIPAPAAVVENAVATVQKSVARQRLHRRREAVARERG